MHQVALCYIFFLLIFYFYISGKLELHPQATTHALVALNNLTPPPSSRGPFSQANPEVHDTWC